ncbi:MAG: DNA topoisomerase VI subunit B, partial [Planctomycetes bacterium]|nr:DNA topoisomerase VI subunit B [Planctomycetota bacterium]
AEAGVTPLTWVKQVDSHAAEALYQALQKARIMAPSTDCLAPIGSEQILAGLLKGIKAEFYTASMRSPTVYRGNPFQVEVGLAYGGDLPQEESARLIRFANRVPLLYQQSHCAIYKSVLETKWRGYGLQQGRGALPSAPLVIMVHFASVWVPFTSESKEAIADYDEIRKEIGLALRECGRKLQTYLRRRHRVQREGERRSMFLRYIGEVANALSSVTGSSNERLRRQLLAIARRRTELADREFDEHGKLIKRTRKSDPLLDGSTVIIDRGPDGEAVDDSLFGAADAKVIGGGQRRTSKRVKTTKGRTRKRRAS